MQLKIILLLITIGLLIFAEILLHINNLIWELITLSDAHDKEFFTKYKLPKLYQYIDTIRNIIYIFILIMATATFFTYLINSNH